MAGDVNKSVLKTGHADQSSVTAAQQVVSQRPATILQVVTRKQKIYRVPQTVRE